MQMILEDIQKLSNDLRQNANTICWSSGHGTRFLAKDRTLQEKM